MIHAIILLSLDVVLCENLSLILSIIQNFTALKTRNSIDQSYIKNKNILSETLIDLGDNVMFRNDFPLVTFNSTKIMVKNSTKLSISISTTKMGSSYLAKSTNFYQNASATMNMNEYGYRSH